MPMIIFAAAEPMSYDECVNLALKNSHAYKIQAENLHQANLAKLDAVSALLPNAAIGYSRSYGLKPPKLSSEAWYSSVEIYQPVFAGFNRLMRISEYERFAVREEYNLKALEKKIRQDTAAAFYALASAQSDYMNVQEAYSLMSEREKELKQREALGKSRLYELYSVQSNLALLLAQIEQVGNNTEKAADSLSLAAGITAVVIIQPVETDYVPYELNADDTAAQQPEVKAIEADIEAMARRSLEAEGAFLPEVNFYASKPLGGTYYPGATDWTFSLRANWTFFDGGSRVLDVMSGLSNEEKLRQQRLAAIKLAAYDVKSKIRDYYASVKRTAALKIAYEKSNKSFKLIEKDYRMGMATNIEVIRYMTDMINVKKALDNEIIAKEKNKVLLEILK